MKQFNPALVSLYQPPSNSHKGQNGKLLVIGGSKLFHSSIFWAADVASRIVDIVHFTSPANENNAVVRKKIKEKFWSGIVVDWGDVERYIEEDDCVLIGPGMVRSDPSSVIPANAGIYTDSWYRSRVVARDDNESGMTMKTAAEYDSTSFIVNYLLAKFPTKKWVIDGGALQEVNPGLITQSCILTPHAKEFSKLMEKNCHIVKLLNCSKTNNNGTMKQCSNLSGALCGATILLKGQVDTVCQGKRCVFVEGGNPGMTKGGTGDVLAGLVAALYCKNDPSTEFISSAAERLRASSWTAATTGSWVNKQAGDRLFKKQGIYYNAQDLLEEIPAILSSRTGGEAISDAVNRPAHHSDTRSG